MIAVICLYFGFTLHIGLNFNCTPSALSVADFAISYDDHLICAGTFGRSRSAIATLKFVLSYENGIIKLEE